MASVHSTTTNAAQADLTNTFLCSVMTPEQARRTQKPYRYGMILLCFGALINWIGLAENYTEPIRYAGVACIISGALLICTAMCCWLHAPTRTNAVSMSEGDEPIHVIAISDALRTEKPPEYETLAPPTYDDAIKLTPAQLDPTMYNKEAQSSSNSSSYCSSTTPLDNTLPSYSSVASGSEFVERNSASESTSPTTTTIQIENENRPSANNSQALVEYKTPYDSYFSASVLRL